MISGNGAEIPMSYYCPLCEEPILLNEDFGPINGGTERAHRECLLRCVMGGIGHLTNHAYWCVEMYDPDGGRSYRQSALEVDQYIHALAEESAND
jgi:hypothetical protein